MRRLVLAAMSVAWSAGVVSVRAQEYSQVAHHPTSYHLTFNDEFNTFNATRWATSDFWGMRNNGGDFQWQWFCDPTAAPKESGKQPHNPFSFKDGVLTITGQPTPAGAYSGPKNQPYVSGQLTSAHRYTQRYGYYELRAKLPTGKGTWSRYWFLTDDGVWPGEYDIFEVIGREKKGPVHQTTHFRHPETKKHAAAGYTYDGINSTDGQFHTYGFLWEPTRVSWYVDGVLTLRQVNRIDKPMYVLIDLALGNDPPTTWPGSVDDTTPFPANMEVDYYRVYSNDPSLPAVTPDDGYTPSTLPEGLKVGPGPEKAPLPADWTVRDVGKGLIPGLANWNPVTGEWMLRGTAFNDGYYFAGTPLTGDGAVVATVDDITILNSNELRAGVVVGDDKPSPSSGVMLYYTSSFNYPKSTKTITLKSRDKSVEPVVVPVDDVDPPVTLKLTKASDRFTGAYSTDHGATWKPVGEPLVVPITGGVSAGLMLGGNQQNYHHVSRATFTNVTVGQFVPTLGVASSSATTGEPIAFNLTLVDALTGETKPAGPVTWTVLSGDGSIDTEGKFTPAKVRTGSMTIKASTASGFATCKVPVTLPQPWTSTDLIGWNGRVPPGDTGVVNGTWTIDGGGSGLLNPPNVDSGNDNFRFVWQEQSGLCSISAKVEPTQARQAGVMIRAVKGDLYAGVWRTQTGVQFATCEAVKAKGALQQDAAVPAGPVWVRLTRSGESADTFAASFSTDGQTWTDLGTRTFKIEGPTRVGLAVAGGSPTDTVPATFGEVSVTGTAR